VQRMSTASPLQRVGTNDVQRCMDQNQRVLGWAGHVARMEKTRLPRKLLTSCLDTPRKSGGQSLTHGRTLRNTSKRKGIEVSAWVVAAQDRGEWRRRKCKGVVLDLDRKRTNFVNSGSFIRQKNRKSARWEMAPLGNIESHDIDALTGERIWFFRCDDGDREDLNIGELQRALLKCEVLPSKDVATQNADRGAMLTGARPFSGPSLPFCLPVIATRSIVLSIGAESSG
jgi:hypothetical protein